jgi:thiol:disulfide interchange protein DsbD
VIGLVVVALVAASAPIEWLHDEQRAVSLSRSTGRPLLIELRAEWCGACKLLDRHTWADPAVQREIAARFVPLSIDVDERPDAESKFDVTELPTVLVQRRRVSGYVTPAEMLQFLRGEGR